MPFSPVIPPGGGGWIPACMLACVLACVRVCVRALTTGKIELTRGIALFTKIRTTVSSISRTSFVDLAVFYDIRRGWKDWHSKKYSGIEISSHFLFYLTNKFDTSTFTMFDRTVFLFAQKSIVDVLLNPAIWYLTASEKSQLFYWFYWEHRMCIVHLFYTTNSSFDSYWIICR